MSSNPNHETDSAKPAIKQEGTSHSHDSIGDRVGEGVSYVRFLPVLHNHVYDTQPNRHEISGAMKLIHGTVLRNPLTIALALYDSPDNRCAR